MIKTFYKSEMAPPVRAGYSQSPQKPRLMMEWLEKHGLHKHFPVAEEWNPFAKDIFEIAHEKEYVTSYFQGKQPLAGSNGLDWSFEFAESVRYTNASLYYAIEEALKGNVTFSPTSGFHHAKPHTGSGFCTFSGQVIASSLLYRKYGVVGAYLDLDGHFGNSIEDSRNFVTDLNLAVPMYANINPTGYGETYFDHFKLKFDVVLEAIRLGKIQYVVACSGADSLRDDDMSGQVDLETWCRIKEYIYRELAQFDKTGWKFPTTICLFGGYRTDHYDSVLDAHTLDLLSCLKERFEILENYKSSYKFKCNS